MIALVLALIVGTLATPGITSRTEFGFDNPVPTVFEPDDPTRTVDLWGIHSGFAKARHGINGQRKPITVGALPTELATPENYELLDRGLDEWNLAAGWELFIPDFDNPDTDITFHVNDTINLDYGAWAVPVQFETGWYRHCRIYLHSWGPPLRSTWAHEIGHCLGFEDVETSESGYFGIMSYGRRGDTFPNNPQDIASLEAVGYRPEGS